MSFDYGSQALLLSERAAERSSENGAYLLQQMDENATLLVAWIGHLLVSTQAESPKVLLRGTQAAAVEAAGCVSLGLIRPALFSMRGQIDMMMAWIYFRDHPVEWRHAHHNAGEGKLRGEVIKYLGIYYPRFRERWKLLVANRTRVAEEPYGVLSAHVHSLTPTTVPSIATLPAMVSDTASCAECATLQFAVSEYLNDIFLASHADKWVDLPNSVQTAIRARLSSSQLKDLTSIG